ncbi:Uncharacterized protein TCAP_07536, partial [Tolypocladium capitatum]
IGKYVYLPPAVIGQLLWNLRHALFGDRTEEDGDEAEGPVVEEPEREHRGTLHQQQRRRKRQRQQPPKAETPVASVTVSQQVSAQFRSDITYSTQLIPSTPDGDHDDTHQHPASTPYQQASSTMKPPPSTTKLARTPASTTKQPASIRPSQATTASQSSTPEKLSPHPLPPPPPPISQQQRHQEPSSTSSGSLSFLDHGASLVSLPTTSSLPASQLLTCSQLLPDSLVHDSDEPPPPHMPVEIWDSDDDDAPL